MQTRCRFASLAAALALAIRRDGRSDRCAQDGSYNGESSPRKDPPQSSAAATSLKIAGCNATATRRGICCLAGKVPENLWLTGDTLGWRGPWGTTYASNLREKVGKMSEAQWLQYARTTELRPPDAVVHVARDDRSRPSRALPVHRLFGPGRPARAGVRAARQGAAATVRDVPGAPPK